MQLKVGSIEEGKVTGITGFGAFVTFPDGQSGLVHISEIANSYVENINDHLKVGDTVKVKVLAVSPDGKINISIKKAQEPEAAPRRNGGDRPAQSFSAPFKKRSGPQMGSVNTQTGDASFEDKLKQFMQESDSRIADSRAFSDRKNSRRKK